MATKILFERAAFNLRQPISQSLVSADLFGNVPVDFNNVDFLFFTLINSKFPINEESVRKSSMIFKLHELKYDMQILFNMTP